jgi:hypothetical protein
MSGNWPSTNFTGNATYQPLTPNRDIRFRNAKFRPERRSASYAPAWFPSGGDRGRECGKADTSQQVLETRVAPQRVHARIYMKIDEPVGMLLVGFL